MENIELLVKTLSYIEENLKEPIKTDDIAKSMFCSKSTVEKLFKYCNNISIRDYIIRRRMSKAALELANNPERSILDVGLDYGYGSNEAFSRAFFSVWNISPSEFRKNPSRFELFPGFSTDQDFMEDNRMSERKKVDISELYDTISERKGCFLVVGDIRSLIPINNISFKAGDMAIITAMNRMENAAGEDDIVFRVGGDEFVILTNSTDEKYAEDIMKEILSHNKETFNWEGQEIPLSMYAKCVKFEVKGGLRYSELFTMIQDEINDAFKKRLIEEQGIL